jgi:hypothetical protein
MAQGQFSAIRDLHRSIVGEVLDSFLGCKVVEQRFERAGALGNSTGAVTPSA